MDIEKIEVSTKAPANEMREAVERLLILIEAERTHNDIREILRNALKALFGSDEYGPYIRDTKDSIVYYERENGDGKTWQVSYVIDDSSKVTFGDPAEVVQKTVYEVVEAEKPPKGAEVFKESALESKPVKLIEKAVRKDGTIPIKIIGPGWGTTGYYSEEVLARDAGIYKEGTKMYWNHPTPTEENERPERDLNHLAGVLISTGVWEENGTEGPGIYSHAKIFENYQSSVDEMAEHIGISHIASGTASYGEAEGKTGKLVETLDGARCVDFVTTAGAGGEIIQMFESAGVRSANIKKEMEEKTDGKELAQMKESNITLTAENVRQKEQLMLIEAGKVVGLALSKEDVKLPDATKNRLQESLVKNPNTDDKGELDKVEFGKTIEAAIAKEVEYISDLTKSGDIHGMGESGDPEGDPDKFKESMQESFEMMGLDPDQAKVAANGHK